MPSLRSTSLGEPSLVGKKTKTASVYICKETVSCIGSPKHGLIPRSRSTRLRALLSAHITLPKKAPRGWFGVLILSIVVLSLVSSYWTVNSSDRVRKLNHEAYLLEEDAEYGKALEVRKKRWSRASGMWPEISRSYAYTECLLANTYRLLEEYDKATPLMEEARKRSGRTCRWIIPM